MAIADRSPASSDGTSGSLTYQHTVLGTTDRVIWVCVDSWRSAGSSDPTGVTYAGAALTKLANFLGGGGNDNAISIWRGIAPATGTNNVVVTHSQPHDITAMSISYSGANQTTPNDTVQVLDSTATDPSQTITSEVDDLVVSFVAGWGTAADAWQAAAPLVERMENNNGNGINSLAVGDAPGAASVVCTWNTSVNPSDPHGMLSFNVNQSGAAPVATSLPPRAVHRRLPLLTR